MTDWTPAELNPTFWIDFSDSATLTLAGSTITAVQNKGSQVLTISGVGSPQLITAAQNGLDVAEIANPNSLALSANATPGGDRTVFNLVADLVLVNVNAHMGPFLSLVAQTTGWQIGDNGGANSRFSPSLSRYNLLTHTSASNVLDRYIDGRVHSSGYTNTSGLLTFSSISTNVGTIRVAEQIIFDFKLTREQILVVEGYLAAKWGLQSQLQDTHPYKSAAPQIEDVLTVSQAEWTPDRYGAAVWFDASDPSTIDIVSGHVDRWRMKNSSSVEAVPANTDVLVQSNDLNGMDTVLFNKNSPTVNTAYGTAIANLTPWQNRITCLVWQRDTSGNVEVMGLNANNYQYLHYVNDWYVGGGALQSVPITDGVYHLASQTSDHNTATRYLDGVANVPTATNSTDGFTGFNRATFSTSNFRIAELVTLEAPATDIALLQKLEGYLAQKWGLTLDPGHPYTSATPTIDVYSVAVDEEIPDYEIELCTAALADYLPNDRTFEAKGIAGSNLRDLLQGLAYEFCRGQAYIDLYSDDYHPATTQTYLDEWERAVGIPDDCFLGTGSTAERQRDIAIKLAAMNIQTAQDIIDLAALLGLTVSVAYGTTATPPLDVPFTPQSETGAYTIIIEGVGIFGGLPPFDVPFVPGSAVNVLECLLAKQIQADCEIIFREA